eukprot:gnl/MRDRNA2_/MRDRNA2_132724_c0_seq1.p1 gnl/MRDRNA2_/MRDRNA2_132724_c0~~gnl/MRDRNA2_/MRDRNA2_132724_c0_seq1.p1  ORF type:complete len:717 (+),score=103.93 gnl/MRDRNA2_/MRDRNA2_132724_c0_seq1:126-2153(+)
MTPQSWTAANDLQYSGVQYDDPNRLYYQPTPTAAPYPYPYQLHTGHSENPFYNERQMVPAALPLADLLFSAKILDEKAIQILNQAPLEQAQEVLLSLGTHVRNPSAFVTSKLAELRDKAQQEAATASNAFEQDGKMTSTHTPAPESVAFWAHGKPWTLKWTSRERAIADLLSFNVIDIDCANLLHAATEEQLKALISSLKVDVHSPSRYLTSRISRLTKEAGFHSDNPPPAVRIPGSANATVVHELEGKNPWRDWKQTVNAGNASVISYCFNGKVCEIEWISPGEQSLRQLQHLQVLDAKCVDLLLTIPEQVAKEIISNISPEIRCPAAYVTSRARNYEIESQRDFVFQKALAEQKLSNGQLEELSNRHEVSFYANGTMHKMKWESGDQAAKVLEEMQVLDSSSAESLRKAPDAVSRMVVSLIGPEIRHPSKFVTATLKELVKRPSFSEMMTVYFNGTAHDIPWISQAVTVRSLHNMGILDKDSADALLETPEAAVKTILASLGPKVRNVNAYVCSRCKEWTNGGLNYQHDLAAFTSGIPLQSMYPIRKSGTDQQYIQQYEYPSAQAMAWRGDQNMHQFGGMLPMGHMYGMPPGDNSVISASGMRSSFAYNQQAGSRAPYTLAALGSDRVFRRWFFSGLNVVVCLVCFMLAVFGLRKFSCLQKTKQHVLQPLMHT